MFLTPMMVLTTGTSFDHLNQLERDTSRIGITERTDDYGSSDKGSIPLSSATSIEAPPFLKIYAYNKDANFNILYYIEMKNSSSPYSRGS